MYTHEFWRSDKNDIKSRKRKKIPENDDNYDHYCIEFAIGLKSGDGILTYLDEEMEEEDAYCNSIDPEDFHGYPPYVHRRVLDNTLSSISKSFDLFFSNIRNSMKKIVSIIDQYRNGPIYFYKQLQPPHQGLDDKLIKKLKNMNFTSQEFDANAQNWLKIIKRVMADLDSFYNYEDVYRRIAWNWDDEPTHMNPYFGSRLKMIFGDDNDNNARVSNGDADHFVFGLPIEDKLIRSTEGLPNAGLIERKFNKHKAQFKRQASHKFIVVFLSDIRDEIKEGRISAFPLQDCFEIFHEDNIWFAVCLFQVFSGSPSVQ